MAMNFCEKLLDLEKRAEDFDKRLHDLEEVNLPSYTQKDAAAYLGISRHTLRRHTLMGLINSLPGTTRYLKKDLDRYKRIRSKT